ncbi:M16 family metallopeptidase [Flavilitoribacter nigricans]|uniref:Peptidase M16 n=1 Tax=Flavilitoribacter nigricans (strain ATCC 23147 / DSM 23189 / NBRC 102662 / NCIMB 1420 / SS-2) TaxID=1122177 RepID=A0A2D0NGF3_FLAN2|nr:pitrilysin family protein [Flavilitoribacter nigricans]PHN07584.1 peptidase M16 [Flavilitoribacter nigricans DSM 23189 = NBRC 102662]
MQLKLWLSLCASLLLTVGQAQMNQIEFEEYQLDNGLQVILHQDKSTPIVAVSVMYHVGSKNEKPDRTGFAHFFEHLLFEGSENIERGEFDKYVTNAGGTLNANTSWDRTFYYEVLPSNQLDLGLWLESERMLHAKVEEVGIETQREVVKEERRQRVENQPYGSILEEIFGRAYQEHPYQWPVIGSMDHLNAATEEDYVSFYETFYVPNNAILSIAGDIDFDKTKKAIEKYFGGIPKGTNPIYRPEVKEPPLTAEIKDTVYDNIQLPAVIQAYRIPAQGTEDFYAVSMLGTLLSDGQSSRLYRALVDEQQKALAAGNFPISTEDPGLTLNFGIANMGVDVQELESAINAEIERVQKDLISEKEFQKLRNKVENDFITANSTVFGIAESLANYKMYFGDANLINTELDRYLKVTREDIREAARKYLNKNNRVSLHYLPKPTQP